MKSPLILISLLIWIFTACDNLLAPTLLPDAANDPRTITYLLTLIFSLHHSLEQELDLDLVPRQIMDLRRIRTQKTALDGARNRAPVLKRSLDQIRTPARSFDLGLGGIAPIFERAIDRDGYYELLSYLDRGLGEVRQLVFALANDQNIGLDPGAGLEAWTLLANACSIFGDPRASSELNQLMRRIETSFDADGERAVLPWALRDHSSASLTQLVEVRETSGREEFGVLIQATNRLRDVVTLLADRGWWPSQYAPYVRLSALAIAQNLDILRADRPLIQRFVDVAVGITALEAQESFTREQNEAIALIYA